MGTNETYPTILANKGTAMGSLGAGFALLGVPDADKKWDANKKYVYILNIRRQNEAAIRINIIFKIFDEVKILLSLPDWS